MLWVALETGKLVLIFALVLALGVVDLVEKVLASWEDLSVEWVGCLMCRGSDDAGIFF